MKRAGTIGLLLTAALTPLWAGPDYSAVQKTLGIPLSVARVTDALGEHPSIVLVQDVHRHPQAQKQIASLILYGLGRWGIRDVFIEGSWSDELASEGAAVRFPDVADALTRRHDFRFLGLEDSDLYRQNVAAYDHVQTLREDAVRELNTARLLSRVADGDPGTSWDLLQKLVELRMKPSEWEEYQKHPFRREPETALSRAAGAAEHFYRLADERSRVFLIKAEAVHTSGTQMLVVGGFHTAEMASALRAKGMSFAVLAPHLTRGGYEELYQRGMQETVSALKLR